MVTEAEDWRAGAMGLEVWECWVEEGVLEVGDTGEHLTL